LTSNIPSPSDLTYFVEVARLLNLSRAAESLGISQPSLTMAIKRIEHAIGTEILVRHKQGVSLSIAGKQLLAHTRLLLQQWDTIKSETLASQHDVQGCFTIGCHPSVALYSLPRFMGKLMKSYPKLEIKLQHDLSRRITEQVINLKIDIGIAVNPTRHTDLIIKPLSNDKISLWRGSTESTIHDLQSGEAVLLCDPDLIQTQAILKEMKKRHMKFSRIISSNNLEVIADLTKSHSGIGILPGNVATTRHLTPIAKSPYYEDEICLLYRGENRNVKAIQIITSAIKSAFERLS
jgi:LysR family transcriptional regulator, cell division regulator